MDKIKPSQEVIAPVVKTVQVSLPLEDAFRFFTGKVQHWWPLASHSMGGENAEACILEGRAGGRFYEVQKDGTQSDWGMVLAWEPPHKVSFTMHPGRTPDLATEVEVSFSPQESGGHTGDARSSWVGAARRNRLKRAQ